MTETKPQPADDEYSANAVKQAERQRLAGIMLAGAVGYEMDGVPQQGRALRQMAEDYAREAAELHVWMRDWRLAHGYDK